MVSGLFVGLGEGDGVELGELMVLGEGDGVELGEIVGVEVGVGVGVLLGVKVGEVVGFGCTASIPLFQINLVPLLIHV